jgi:hypothetical protein
VTAASTTIPATERSIELDASPERIWRALTGADPCAMSIGRSTCGAGKAPSAPFASIWTLTRAE